MSLFYFWGAFFYVMHGSMPFWQTEQKHSYLRFGHALGHYFFQDFYFPSCQIKFFSILFALPLVLQQMNYLLDFIIYLFKHALISFSPFQIRYFLAQQIIYFFFYLAYRQLGLRGSIRAFRECFGEWQLFLIWGKIFAIPIFRNFFSHRRVFIGQPFLHLSHKGLYLFTLFHIFWLFERAKIRQLRFTQLRFSPHLFLV